MLKKIQLKTLTITAAIALGTFVAKAQSTAYKPFRVGFDFGYAITSGPGQNGGVIIAVEPKYAVNNNLALGLRMEAMVAFNATLDSDGYVNSGSLKISSSYLATADYYFNTNKFRPFAGLGAGVHLFANGRFIYTGNNDDDSDFIVDDTEFNAGTKFGITPRAGFDYGHFRFAVDYNFVGKTGTVTNNYLGIKLGFFLGGGSNDENSFNFR